MVWTGSLGHVVTGCSGTIRDQAYTGLPSGEDRLSRRSQPRRLRFSGFSDVDLSSHKRGFPALLDVMQGIPVGALVFAEDAIAGDIWTPGGGRYAIKEAVVVGPRRLRLTPAPDRHHGAIDPRFDRQVRLFGTQGQSILGKSRVAIIGVGGVGILLAEYLGRLGVAKSSLLIPIIDPTNLPRMVDATGWDAMSWLVANGRPDWIRHVGPATGYTKGPPRLAYHPQSQPTG